MSNSSVSPISGASVLLLRSDPLPVPIPIVNAFTALRLLFSYHLMMTGCSHGRENSFVIFSCGGVVCVVRSLVKFRCIVSYEPILDSESVLSMFVSPPIRLALDCNHL